MLLILKILAALLLLFNIIGDTRAGFTDWGGCEYHPFGETTLRIGATIRDNLINVLGFLEKQNIPEVPSQAYSYFSSVKRRVIANEFDIFRLITFIPHLQNERTSQERVIRLLKELEKVDFKQNCQLECSISKWELNLNVRNLLNMVPYNLTAYGLLIQDQAGLDFVSHVGTRFMVVGKPMNQIEQDIYDNFGPSIMLIMREIQQSKHCFNEKFFGYLLPFYSWPKQEASINIALVNLRGYFTRGYAVFLPCHIYMSDLNGVLDQPWALFDYIFNQMDSTGCERRLELEIRKVMSIRQSQDRDEVTGLDVACFPDLLNVITPDIYPPQIILARDRLHRYLTKLLPYIDQHSFVRYLYDTPEEQLLALLNYVSQINPYPIPDINHCVKAIKSHLIFQKGRRRVSTKLLNFIYDAWWTPDLLDEPKHVLTDLKLFIRNHFGAIDNILSAGIPQYCTGILDCYMKITSILASNLNFKDFTMHLQPPSCFIGTLHSTAFPNGSISVTTPTTTLESLFATITHEKYPLVAVVAAQKVYYALQHANHKINVVKAPGMCTKDEVLLYTLETVVDDPDLVRIRNDIKRIITEIKRKIGSHVPETTILDASPPVGLQQINTQSLIQTVLRVRDANATTMELDAALLYIQGFAPIIDRWLSLANCDTDVGACFENILQIVRTKLAKHEKLNVFVLRFVLSPTVCYPNVCRWLPYEEKECGLLNPLLVYIIHLLKILRDGVHHFQIQLDLEAIVKVLEIQNVGRVLNGYVLNTNESPKDQVISFIGILHNLFNWNDAIRVSTSHITEFLVSKEAPKTLSVQNLFYLIHVLIRRTKDEGVATSMKENVQLLYKNKERVQVELSMLPVDCRTLESCVASLLSEANYTSGNAIINAILGAIQNKLCTREMCPWMQDIAPPNKVLASVLNELVAIERENGTPLVVIFAIDRLKKYLHSSDFRPHLEQLDQLLIDCNSAVSTVLTMIMRESSVDSMIRHDAQNVNNYIRNKIPPHNINVDDIIRLLTLLKHEVRDEALKEKIRQIMGKIQSESPQWASIVQNLFVDCRTLMPCLNNLVEALQYEKPHPPSVTELIQLLDTIALPNQQNVTELVNGVINTIHRLIDDPQTPFHIGLDLRQVERVIRKREISSLFGNVTHKDPVDILLGVLENFPLGIKLQYNIDQNIANIINYYRKGILPTRLNTLTLQEFAYILTKSTTSEIVKNEIVAQAVVLSQLPATADVLQQLPVKCDTFQSCADSITSNIKQLVRQNQVTQIIYMIVNPSSCTAKICPWIRVNTHHDLRQKTDELRKQLMMAVQSPSTPLLIKIYADELLNYVTPDTVAGFKGDDLLQLLGYIAQCRVDANIREMALALMRYIDRNVIPVIWKHGDLLGLSKVMTTATTDTHVHRDIREATNSLMFHGVYVDKLLAQCHVNGRNLNTVVVNLYECAISHPKEPASHPLLQYLFPKSCKIQTCSWIIEQRNASLPKLISNALNEINYLLNLESIPFHIKLDLMQVRDVIRSIQFLEELKRQNANINIEHEFQALVNDAKRNLKDILPPNIVSGDGLCDLLGMIPGNMLTSNNIFGNVFNVLAYFAKGTLPRYLEMGTIQQLAEVLAKMTTDHVIAMYIISQSKKLAGIRQATDWLNTLDVHCDTLQNCVSSIRHSMVAQTIPNDLYQVLESIISPNNCTRKTCPWLDFDGNQQVTSVINQQKNELIGLLENPDTPLAVTIAINQLLRYISAEHIGDLVNDNTTLEELLEKISKDSRFSQELQQKALSILQYIRQHSTSQGLTSCNDLHTLAQHMLHEVQDYLVQQEIKVFDNRLRYQEEECDRFIQQCQINCVSLRPCVAQLYECTRQYNTSLTEVLNLFLSPPSCTPQTCSWIPPERPNKTLSEPQILIILFQADAFHVKSIMLDSSNEHVVNQLRELSSFVGSHPNTLTVIKVQISPGNYLNIPIDLTNSYIQKSLISSKHALQPLVDCNTMKTISVLWPIGTSRIKHLTFDLTDRLTRERLRKLGQRPCSPGKPAILVRDIDGSQFMVCFDFTDELLLREFLEVSVEGKRIVQRPSILFWPRNETDCWGALQLDKLGSTELAVLQNFPCVQTIGVPVDILITNGEIVSFCFDVYNHYIGQSLNVLSGGVVPIIVSHTTPTRGMIIPNDYGRLTNVYVTLTAALINQLHRLTAVNPGSQPSFVIKVNNTAVPICLNLHDAKVKQILESFFVPPSESNTGEDFITIPTGAVQQIISMFIEQLRQHLNKPHLPFILKLDINAVLTVLETNREKAVSLFARLPNSLISELYYVTALIADQGITSSATWNELPACLEKLPPSIFDDLGITWNVKNILYYLNQNKLVINLHCNTLVELLDAILHNNVRNETVATEVKHLISTIASIPGIDDWLPQLNVSCETYDYCVKEIWSIVQTLPPQNKFRQIMNQIFDLCNITSSMMKDEQLPPTVIEVIQKITNAIQTILIEDQNLPFIMKLNLQALLNLLQDERTQAKLLEILASLPREHLDRLLVHTQRVLQQLINNPTTTEQDILKQLLETIPLPFVIEMNMQDLVDQIMQYFTNGTVPVKLNIHALQELGTILANSTNDSNVAHQIQKWAATLATQESLGTLFQIGVNCVEFETCVNSIVSSIDALPVQDNVTHIIRNIIKPPTCTQQTCKWILPDKSSPIIELLDQTINALVQLKNSQNLPLHVVLDIEVLKDILANEDTKKLLVDIINSLPESEQNDMIAKSQALLDRLNTAGAPNIVDLTKLAFENLPNSFLKMLGIEVNIMNVRHYLESGVMPTTMNKYALDKLIEIIQKNSNPETTHLIMDQLKDVQNVNAVLQQMHVQCYTVQMCINSLADGLQTNPSTGNVTHILSEVVSNVTHIWNGVNNETLKDNFEYVILNLGDGTQHVFLNLQSELVIETLIDIHRATNPSNPNIIFHVTQHPHRPKREIKLDLTDFATIKALHELEMKVIKFSEPKRLVNQYGSFIVGIVEDSDGRLKSFVIHDDEETRNLFLPKSTKKGPNTIRLPFQAGELYVLEHPRNVYGVKPVRMNYFPDGKDHQPGEITLPNGLVIIPDWSTLYMFDTPGKGTVIPVLMPDGSYTFITLDLRNQTLVDMLILKSTNKLIQPCENSMLIFTVPDGHGGVTQVMLNLNDESVLKHLGIMSQRVNTSSDRLIVFNYVDANNKLTSILFDLNNVDVKLLEMLGQKTSINTAPIYIRDEATQTDGIVLMVKDAAGKVRPVILKLNDDRVIQALISMSDATNPHATSIYIKTPDGSIIRVFIDTSQPHIVEQLIKLCELTPIFEKPLPNVDPNKNGSAYVIVNHPSKQKTLYKIRVDNPQTIQQLKDLAQGAPPGTPYICLESPDGFTTWIKLDVTDPKVAEFLKSICQEVVTETPSNNLLVLTPPNHVPIVIDISQSTVINRLLNISSKIENSAGLNVFTVVDSFGNFHTIALNLTDPETVKILEKLGYLTSTNLRPSVIPNGNNSFVTVFTVTDQQGAPISIVLDGSNQTALQQLLNKSDVLNPSATKIIIFDHNNRPVTIYLDLSDNSVCDLLKKIQKEREKILEVVPPNPTDNKETVIIPTFVNGHESILKCNVSKPEVAMTLLKLSGIGGINKVKYRLSFTDWTGANKVVEIDTSNPNVVSELNRICVHPPHTDDILLITVQDENNATKSFVLNTKDETIQNKLKLISNMTQTGGNVKNATVVQITDADGNVCSIYLDLNNPQVIAMLEKLHQLSLTQIPPMVILTDEQGDKTLLVMQVDNGVGGLTTVVLDTKDPKVLDMLNEITKPDDVNAVAIEVFTVNGKMVFYINKCSPVIIRQLIEISKQRKPRPPLIVRPTYAQASVINIPFTVGQRTLVVTVNVTEPQIRQILLDASTMPSSTTTTIYVQDDHGEMKACYIDTTNVALAEKILHFATKYEYSVQDNTLMIAPLIHENGKSEYVVLDLTNENVTQALKYISNNFGNDEFKNPFYYLGNDRIFDVCQLDLTDSQTREQLLKLQQQCVPWIKPIQVVNPYGPLPFLVTTILDQNGRVRPIVLDTNDDNVISRLQAMQTVENRAKRSLQLKYVTADGSFNTIYLDVGDPVVVQTLLDLSKPPYSYPTEVITNQPVDGGISKTTLVIPIQNNSQLLLLSFDTSRPDVFNGILGCAAPLDEPASVIYMQNPHGEMTAIRINTKDEQTVTQLKYLSKSQRVKMDPKSLVVFVVPDNNGKSVPIILDVFNEEVVDGLKKLADITQPNGTTVLVSVSDASGYPIPAPVDLQQFPVIEQLKKLQEKTPNKILPVLMPNPIAPRPFIVITIADDWHKALPVVLDTNNMDVVDKLIALSQFEDPDAYMVEVTDRHGRYVQVYINPENPRVKRALRELAGLCSVLPLPVTSPNPNQVIVVPIRDVDGKNLHILLDPTDSYAMNLISQIPPTNGPALIITAPDSTGAIKPLRLNKGDINTISLLKKLGKRLPDVIRPCITLPTGPLPLLSIYKLADNKVNVVVIDSNNPATVNHLLKLRAPNDRHPDIVRLKLPSPNGKVLPVNLPDTPDTGRVLVTLSETVPLSLQPLKVILPGKRKPLLCLVLPEPNGFAAITIDVEDDAIFEELKYFDTGKSPEAITIEFDTPRTKVAVNLNIRDVKIIEKLKNISPKVPVIIIPVPDRYPLLCAKLGDGEEVFLDTDNPMVVDDLVKISLAPGNRYYPQTEIALKNNEAFTIPIGVAFSNPDIYAELKRLSRQTPVPRVKIVRIPTNKLVQRYPVRIMPPGPTTYPLVFIEMTDGTVITLDPNNYQVMNYLLRITKDNNFREALQLWVSNTRGDIIRFVINPNDPRTTAELKKLAKLCPIKIEPKTPPYLPTLLVKLPDKLNKKRPLAIDLQNPQVLNIIASLSKNLTFTNPTKLQIDAGPGRLICFIDFNDPTVIKALENLRPGPSKQPFFITFEVPDTLGNAWNIIIDMENDQVMGQLWERSNKTAPQGATVMQLQTKEGRPVNITLNLYDPNTINLLKTLTELSTGRPATMVQKKPRRLMEVTVYLPNGQTATYKLDINNESVMKKLKQLSSMYNGNSPTTVDIPQSTGGSFQLKLDLTNPITMQNLQNLQEESLGGKPQPVIPLDKNPSGTGTGQTMLITFNVNSPHYGDVSITLNLYLPGMIDKLRQLSASFVQGRPETQVPIDDQRGNKLLLLLDVTAPKTIEYLAQLTEESTGKNPLSGKPPVSPTQIYTADLLTIEIPYGVETLPLTFDQKDKFTVSKLMLLDRKVETLSLTVVEIEMDGQRRKLALETSNRQVIAQLQTVGIPTVFPHVARKVQLITIMFLPSAGNLSPIVIDMALNQSVMTIIELSQKYPRTAANLTYVEVRDDTGQYLRVPLDLSNTALIHELTSRYPPQPKLNIDARTMPFLTFVVPTMTDGGYSVVKFQTKPKVLKELIKKFALFNGQGVPITIVDILETKHTFALNVNAPQFVSIISQLETAAVITPSVIKHLFLIYTVDQNGDIDPVYLNLHIARTLEVLQNIRYTPNTPLTVIQYRDERGQLQYKYLSIVDKNVIGMLSQNSYVVGGHSIVKQMLVNKVVLTIPAGKGSMQITLNLADPRILREIKDITQNANPNGTLSIVEMEDAYGYPIILKFDYTDQRVVDRLKALSSPN